MQWDGTQKELQYPRQGSPSCQRCLPGNETKGGVAAGQAPGGCSTQCKALRLSVEAQGRCAVSCWCSSACAGWLVAGVCGSWQADSKGTCSESKRSTGEAASHAADAPLLSTLACEHACKKCLERAMGIRRNDRVRLLYSLAWLDVARALFHVVCHHEHYLDPGNGESGKSASEINTS